MQGISEKGREAHMRPTRILLTVLIAALLLWSLEAVAQQQPSPPMGFQGWGATPPGGYPPNYYQIPATSQSGWVTMQGPTAPPPGGYPGNYYQIPATSQSGWKTMQK
jgi:hypothetical protein